MTFWQGLLALNAIEVLVSTIVLKRVSTESFYIWIPYGIYIFLLLSLI